MSGKSHMHGGGESHGGVAPAKQPNQSGPSGLARVREAAKDGKLKFTALLHHVSIDLHREGVR